MEDKHKGSRTYRVVMSHSMTGETLMISSATYKGAQACLTYWEQQWKAMDLEVNRNRTEVRASGELADVNFAVKIWLTENK